MELPRHANVLAEGLPTESYLDTGNKALFANAPTVGRADQGEQAAKGQTVRLAGSCLPFVSEPGQVEPIWRALAERAVALGWKQSSPPALTGDPDLHVRVGTRRLRPVSARNGRYLFSLPAHRAPLWLVSRAARPQIEHPWVEDRRRLGVRVNRLTLRCGQDERAIPLDHPFSGPGWWAVEQGGHGPCRWTNGEASLPTLEQGLTRPGTLEVVVTGSRRYPATDAP